MYKVRELRRRKFLRGRVTAAALQRMIDAESMCGWTLDRVVTTTTAWFWRIGKKEVHLLIFKKEEA